MTILNFLLKEKKLWFSQVNKFDDKFEGGIQKLMNIDTHFSRNLKNIHMRIAGIKKIMNPF